MFNKKYVFFISFLSIILFSNQQKKLKVLEDWDEYEISIDGITYRCPLCIPYKIKSLNGKITISIPRLYNFSDVKNIATANVTFLALNTNYENDHFWEAWPSEEYVFIKNKNAPIKIYSVMGYDIDAFQNYYLLDHGIIFPENNTIMQNTSKLLIFSKKGVLKKIYYFNGTDFETSLLTDIVVDQSKKFAYITDSGILLNNESYPRIIAIDLENEKVYKILNNNSNFKPDENVPVVYSENEIYNYFTNITGLNSIQISCDEKMLYFSSLRSKKLYRVKTEDILNSIKKFTETNDESVLNNIDITMVDKKLVSQTFFISSKNNLFMTNGEDGSIRTLYTLDEDLINFNFDDFSQIKTAKFIINWPGSIDIDNGKLIVLDNHYYIRNSNKSNNMNFYGDAIVNNDTDNETVGNFVIYVTDLEKDEYSHKRGCTIYIFQLNFYSIFLLSWFLIILIIVIFVMIINKERNKKNKNNENNEKEEENVKELNRRLNECASSDD